MRSRGLTQAGYDARETYGDINRQLKGNLNRAFGKVAIKPIPDFAPPKPVMQNVGMTLMLGMGKALGAGLEGMGSTGDGLGPTLPSGTGTSMGQSYTYTTDPTFGHQIRTFQSY
jgi:hypothetical protein